MNAMKLMNNNYEYTGRLVMNVKSTNLINIEETILQEAIMIIANKDVC